MTIDNAFAAAHAGKCTLDMGNQELRARLDLFEQSIVLTRYKSGAPLSVYEISPDALAVAFSGLPVMTGLLPQDCLFYAGASSVVRLGIYLPPGTHTLTVAGEPDKWSVPLPGLVFVGNGGQYRVFAVKQRPAEAAERLFYAPLPNVYQDGKICAGSVSFPACSTATIHTAAKLFLGSGFNRDLSAGKCRAHNDNVLELLKELSLENRDVFPANQLVKTELKLEDLYGAA